MATLKNTVVNSTEALQLPVGTTAQRPTAATGQMRYNSNLGTCEFYDGTRWKYMPDIVRSGLVLHLDAAEPLSYNTVSENLLLWSENYLDSSAWNRTSYPVTVTLQPNIAPPIANMSVYSIVQIGTWGLISQGIQTSVTGTGILTATVYAKQYTATGFTLNVYYDLDGEVNISFNLSNGTCDAGGAMTNVGNGWYRCQIQVPARVGAGTTVQFRIWPDYRGANTSNGCYFAGAQLETGSSASAYFKTTSVIKTRTTTWADLSENGYNGTVDAGVTFNTNYWNFDYGQVNDRITIANNSHLNYDYANWSYNIWLYYESADSGSWKQLFVKGDGGSYRRPGILFYADDPQKLHITWSDGNQEAITKTGFSVPIGTWSNITIQASSGTMTSYLNGVQDSQSIAISNKAANSNPLYIGNISGSYTAPNMRMGVFQTYNRALTPVEIQQNFNAIRGRYGL